MIDKIIHQVFWPFNGKEIYQIPSYNECIKKTKLFCEKYNYEYKFWHLKDCEELICEKYPEYIVLWTEFRYDIQRCDFIRFLILYEYGGWYVDCDSYPLQDLKPLSKNKEVFTTFNDSKNKIPCNAEMGTEKKNPLFLKICNDIIIRVQEKQSKKIYDSWKGRLVFHTTGGRMLNKHVPKSSIYDLLDVRNKDKKLYVSSDNPYFYENCISLWYNNGKNL